MEAVDFNKRDSRFHVYRTSDGVVEFHGALTDTTEFIMLDDILTDGCLCDFVHLEFSSWIGISGLVSYIKGNDLNLVFRNLPYQFSIA